MSALVTIFNYQFSTLGQGTLSPITVEEAYAKLNVIGTGSITESKRSTSASQTTQPLESSIGSLEEYLNKLDFGEFTYSSTLLKWYRLLCRGFKVRGRCYYFYRTTGKNKTDLAGKEALKVLVGKLHDETTQFIYRAYDHYFCPVGY